MSTDNCISEESAREQFNKLIEFYDVDMEDLGKDARTRSRIERKVVKAIMQGRVEIEDSPEEFRVKQTLRDGSEFVYGEVTGISKIQMDKYEGQHEKLYQLLASLSKKPVMQIKKLSGPDLSIAEYLSLIFLMD
jgi:hypothetical protein